MKLLNTLFSKSLVVRVGHTLVHTTIVNLNFGLKSACFSDIVLFIKATSASMFLQIMFLSLAMLSLMRLFSHFRHFRVLPHHHHITLHLLCLTSLKMLHTLPCCCLIMVQVLVEEHVFIFRILLRHLQMCLSVLGNLHLPLLRLPLCRPVHPHHPCRHMRSTPCRLVRLCCPRLLRARCSHRPWRHRSSRCPGRHRRLHRLLRPRRQRHQGRRHPQQGHRHHHRLLGLRLMRPRPRLLGLRHMQPRRPCRLVQLRRHRRLVRRPHRPHPLRPGRRPIMRHHRLRCVLRLGRPRRPL
jgi:hypothetical protein